MTERPSAQRSNLAFLQGGGEMGARMRDMDWSTTALGPAEDWPQSLRSTVSMIWTGFRSPSHFNSHTNSESFSTWFQAEDR
jgi:hypothetical protein